MCRFAGAERVEVKTPCLSGETWGTRLPGFSWGLVFCSLFPVPYSLIPAFTGWDRW
jgi:hypothetical protein